MGNDLTKGKRTPVDMVSYTHGRQTLPWVQSLNITPNGTSESYGQFGSDDAVIVVNSFMDADLALEVLVSDQKQLEAMLMDVDPAGDAIVLNPGTARPVSIFAQYNGIVDGNDVIGSVFVPNAVLTGMPSTEDLTTPAKVTYNLKGKFLRKVTDAKIEYSRCVLPGFTGFATAEDKPFVGAGPYTVAMTNVVLVYEEAGGATTKNYLCVMLNGVPIDTGFSIVTALGVSTLTYTGTLAVTDVLEVFTIYQ